MLASVARDLHLEFGGTFGRETIAQLLMESYEEQSAHATVTRWLVVGTERLARPGGGVVGRLESGQ